MELVESREMKDDDENDPNVWWKTRTNVRNDIARSGSDEVIQCPVIGRPCSMLSYSARISNSDKVCEDFAPNFQSTKSESHVVLKNMHGDLHGTTTQVAMQDNDHGQDSGIFTEHLKIVQLPATQFVSFDILPKRLFFGIVGNYYI